MLTALSDLDLRLIRVFMAVVRAGGVTNAQPVLNVGQSTISTQIATLEVRVGYRLCERGRSGFALTEKGRRFYELCASFIDTVDQFTSSARHLDRVLVGTLSVGLVDHAPPAVASGLSKAIARFKTRDEAVRFAMSVGSPAQLEEGLLSGELDIAIGYFWHRVYGLEYRALATERQLAFCGKSHPLYPAASDATIADLEAHEWIARTYPVPEVKVPVPAAHITAFADNLEAAITMIMAGHHLGYLPEHYAEPYVTRGLVRPINPTLLGFDVQFHVVTKTDVGDAPVLTAFMEDMDAVVVAVPSSDTTPPELLT